MISRVLKELVEVDGSRTIELWNETDGRLHIVCSDSGAWEPEWGCIDLTPNQVSELVDVLKDWLATHVR